MKKDKNVTENDESVPVIDQIVYKYTSPAFYIWVIVMAVCGFFLFLWHEISGGRFLNSEEPEPIQEPEPDGELCQCINCRAKRGEQTVPPWVTNIETVTLEDCIRKEKEAADAGNLDQAIFWRDVQ